METEAQMNRLTYSKNRIKYPEIIEIMIKRTSPWYEAGHKERVVNLDKVVM